MESFRITDATQIRQGPELQKQVNSGLIQSEQPRDGKVIEDKFSKSEEILSTNTQKTDQSAPSKDEITAAAEKVNKSLQNFNTKIHVNFDDDTGKMVIHLVDSDSGEMVRQIPSETLLKLSARIAEYLGDWPEKENFAEGSVIDKLI